MSLIPLPIRLAAVAPGESQEETTAIPGIDHSAAAGDAGHDPPALPVGDPNQIPTSPEDLRLDDTTTGLTNHQFWLKDAKIAEDLFTIHRSAKHLVEFTSSIIGNRDPTLEHRPIPVIGDGDVLFMTQLSNDIARSVGGISAVRHHGLRTRKRKSQHNGIEIHLAKDFRNSRNAREDKTGTYGSSSKRLHTSRAEDGKIACFKCGRTETPEWRKGPDGLLCNVCGLLYEKQKRKLKNGS